MAEVSLCMAEVSFCMAEAHGGRGFPPSVDTGQSHFKTTIKTKRQITLKKFLNVFSFADQLKYFLF